ncbi:hypothetical protein KUTeg_011491 [Tegillarca granosa]|uniref:Anti-proliferative protein domain-containing protein n=1 Tax=Tegillarca granosa TaxID=220873 RepID=A0ABQ9F0P3_TEGGR|nr:hypothetical protein KUTeg_011491 [Tegillarca granosa]
MKLEVKSAVDFLSKILSASKNVTLEQSQIFNNTLYDLLCTRYENHWFPEKPFKGSGYRCIRMNHDIDPLIKKAGESCGLDDNVMSNVLPKELTMWVDPKEVCYRIGENGSIGVLYDSESSSGTEQQQNVESNSQNGNEKQVQSESGKETTNVNYFQSSCKNQFINALSKELDSTLHLKQFAAFVYS